MTRRSSPHRRVAAIVALTAGLALTLAFPFSGLAAGPAPTTTIVSGPMGSSEVTSPQFTFSADQPATFACSLDGGAFAACASPDTVGPLAVGTHSFSVRATNAQGVTDPSPPVRSWSVVLPIAAPSVTLKLPATHRPRIKRLTIVAGTSQAPAGVKLVQLALSQGPPQKQYFPPRCRYIDLATGRRILQACLLPPYVNASGTSTWRYVVPARVRRRLAPGRYELHIRALNAYGQATQQQITLTLR